MFGGGLAPFVTASLLAATHTSWSVAGYIDVLAVSQHHLDCAAAAAGQCRSQGTDVTANPSLIEIPISDPVNISVYGVEAGNSLL